MTAPALVQPTDDATATDAEALRHLLASLHERLIYADDALAQGAIKHLERLSDEVRFLETYRLTWGEVASISEPAKVRIAELEAQLKLRAQYIDDTGHRFTDCEAGNCRCDYDELRVWS